MNDGFRLVLGRRLHQAVTDAGFNRTTFSAVFGKSEGALGSWWRGETSPSVVELKKYSELTGKPILWFYGEDAMKSETITISIKEYNKIVEEAARQAAKAEEYKKLYTELRNKKLRG